MTTMQIDRAVVEQALEAVDKLYLPGELERVNAAITALRAALAQQAERAQDQRCRAEPRSDGDFVCDCKIGECPGRGAALAQQDEPAQEPAYKVKVAGRWHDTEPLAAAFSLPDGEHLLYTAPPQQVAQQAEPLNLRDPAVQKRLAAQWGYVPAAQAEPVEPVHEHEDWCASVTQLLLCDPPRKAPCNCKHTAPPQRKPLTEKEIERIGMKHVTLREVIRAVERAHGIGEQS